MRIMTNSHHLEAGTEPGRIDRPGEVERWDAPGHSAVTSRVRVAMSLGWLRRWMFGIAPQETNCVWRQFRVSDERVRAHLEHIGEAFVLGYHAALEEHDPHRLTARLEAVALIRRGFAYEGAAMGLSLQDQLRPGHGHRFQLFLESSGAPHKYMMHVGAGWTLARCGWRIKRLMGRLDPLLRWLAIDGYGFHEGYFHWPRYLTGQQMPRRLTGYAQRVFDQGLGRSLWFVDGADVTRIPQTIAMLSPARHADLWSGIGLACAYAGGVEREQVAALQVLAGRYWLNLAQGAAFAAQTRRLAKNLVPHTETACEILCGMTATAAAEVTNDALDNLSSSKEQPAYELWRQRIIAEFARHG